MKSRTSFFNSTIFKKNLTRFAPAWGLYTVCAVMGLLITMDSGIEWFADSLITAIQILSLITPCYALLCAQLLFGDLYNTRMCNALHALPLRRETWFATNVLSGFAFHLIPTVIMAALAFLYAFAAGVPGGCYAAAMWLLGVNLQFMCFFGIAVFSAFCVGSRFAHAVVYGIVNFAAALVGWMLDTIFIPMYYGIRLNLDPVLWFCPVGQMINAPFMTSRPIYNETDPVRPWLQSVDFYRGDSFLYYFIVAALGIGLLFLAMQLYRRRKLECAGDFMAIPAMEPVFLVVYTLILGCLFHFIADDIFGFYSYVFPFLGLAVGWFTGKMLLERTTRVFRLKSFLRCGALMVAYALTLGIAALDPFGIESWVPEAEKVESVTMSYGWYSRHDGVVTLEDPAEIERIIAIHQEALNFYHDYQGETAILAVNPTYVSRAPTEKEEERMEFFISFTLTYQLKNGAVRNRYYNIWMGGETGQYLKQLFSSPEAVTGYADKAAFLAENSHVCVRDTYEGRESNIYSQADLTALIDAILADCEAGVMGQSWNFHGGDEYLYWLYFDSGLEITVFSNCENTIRWLRDYGIDVDTLLEEKLK